MIAGARAFPEGAVIGITDMRKQQPKRPSKQQPEKRHGRGPARFTKTSVTRGAKAVLAAGLSIKSVQLNLHTGVADYIIGEPDSTTTENPWDEVHDAANKKRPA